LLTHSELRRGLEWLGMKMDHSLVNDIMSEVDKDKDGYINLEEFKSAVGWDEDTESNDVENLLLQYCLHHLQCQKRATN